MCGGEKMCSLFKTVDYFHCVLALSSALSEARAQMQTHLLVLAQYAVCLIYT